jgi:hypothetical protein
MTLPLPFLLNFIESKLISEEMLITVGAVGLIIYIAALILSKTTRCIIVWEWWDLIILAVPGIILIASLYLYTNTEIETGTFINNIAVNILFVLSFIATIALSISANIKTCGIVPGILYSVIAILAKIVIAILIPVFFVLLLGALNSGEKDKRYKSGIRGNKNIILAGTIAAIAALFVGNLIKSGNEEE